MSMWSLRWHFTNKSVTGAPYITKGICRCRGKFHSCLRSDGSWKLILTLPSRDPAPTVHSTSIFAFLVWASAYVIAAAAAASVPYLWTWSGPFVDLGCIGWGWVTNLSQWVGLGPYYNFFSVNLCLHILCIARYNTSQFSMLIIHKIYKSSICGSFDDIVSSVCDRINMHWAPLSAVDIIDIKSVR